MKVQNSQTVTERAVDMEFNEKLQELRKQKGITQEELAASLYVSRTAVSKWESGRGYPNIDSLKAIAKFFSVTVDELLSSEELLCVAEEDTKEKELRLRDLVFALLDFSALMFLFLPFFGQKGDLGIQEVSLLSLTDVAVYLKVCYFGVVVASALSGAMTLVLRNSSNKLWIRIKHTTSLAVSIVGAVVFVLSQQPYAATFMIVFAAIKVLILIKRR